MRALLLAAVVLGGAGLAWAGPVAAEPLREFCSDRPGLDTPPCTIDAGHVAIEAGLADWTLDRQADSRTDSVNLGDFLLRYGVGQTTEAQLGWTAYGQVRTRDRMSGAIDRRSGVGDVTVAVRQNLANPDGSGNSFAVQPYVTLPAGRQPVGAGDWGAGLLVPMSFDLSEALHLGATPEIDAAVDEDGDGRHLAYGGAAGLTAELGKAVNATVEAAAIRDRDPGGHETLLLLGTSIAWQAKDDLIFDIGANLGLNHATPDIELYAGVSRRF